MALNGYIKLFRQLKDWEWYNDKNVKIVFLDLLLSVNFKDTKWQGIEIKRGQIVIGLGKYATSLGLSLQELRTVFSKLKKTGEITTKATNKHTIITICNFDSYQDFEDKKQAQATNEQQTNNKRTTNEQQQRKNVKNNKNEKNIKDIINNIQKPNNFDDELFAIFKDFLQMRKEIKKPFKSVKALETRINTLSKDVDRYGLENVKEAVKNSIANQYQGIFVKGYLDNKVEQPKTKPNTNSDGTPSYMMGLKY
jgi:hypothetical protein